MKKINIFLSAAGISFSLIFLSECKKEASSATSSTLGTTPYTLATPYLFPSPNLSSQDPLTVEGIKLGRYLFYDSILSLNGHSCSTCHIQSRGFINLNTSLPAPLDTTLSRIMPLFNLAWQPYYGWYGQYPTVDLWAADIVNGTKILDINIDTIVNRFNRSKIYPALFNKAFPGQNVISQDKILISVSYAISQFARTIVSANSPYDQYKQGTSGLSPSAQRGMQMFYGDPQYDINGNIIQAGGDCYHCHSSTLFTNNDFYNDGLDSVFVGKNRGRYAITGDKEDLGKFFVPTLRNIGYRAPYMHDGRFQTLMEVIQHYNTGIKRSSTLAPILTKNYNNVHLGMTAQNMADLDSFLLTLDDNKLLTDTNYSSPFKH